MKEYDNLQNNPDIQQFNYNHKDLYNYLKEHSGMNFTDLINDSNTLYDQLLVEVSICKLYIFI